MSALQPYAVLTGGTVTEIEFHDPATYSGTLTLLAGISPMPWIGWTLVNGTWTPPAPPPPTPQQTAQQALQQLAATASTQLTQAQTDAAMFASTPVGSTLTQAHIDALQRFANGFASLIDAISNHCVYTGALPPS